MLTPTVLGSLISFLMVSQFKHVPLYLEWAPLGVFSGKAEVKKDEQTSEVKVRF